MGVRVLQRYGPADLSGFSVREIKYAMARFGLLSALFRALQAGPADAIRIRDLCKAAEVSEPSFFNYFPQKDDLFYYFVGLWSVDSFLYTRHRKPGLETLREFYAYTGKVAEAHPYLMKELLAYQARAEVTQRARFVPPLTLAEKTLAFGRVEGMEQIPDKGIRNLILLGLEQAVRRGELPRRTPLPGAAMAVGGIFFGVAGLCAASDFKGLSAHYLRSLGIVFKGLRAKGR